MIRKAAVLLAGAALAMPALADGFVNGSFDAGTTAGWTIGGGARSSAPTSTLGGLASAYLPGGARYSATIANGHSAVVSPGLDPMFGSRMENIVYSGSHALRVEDTSTGGFLSVASQTVSNYTDPNIFFAWMAVLENGGHSAEQSAAMVVTLRDDTTGTALISRTYNAVGGSGGVDARFNAIGDFYYTPTWQIEQLVIDSSLSGHTFTLSVLASDCGPTAHTGYVYLDGFGAAPPVNDVPEPGSLLLAALGLAGAAAVRRRHG